MGFLDKVMFWRKKEDLGDLDLGKDNLAFGDNFGQTPNQSGQGFGQVGLGSSAQQGFGQGGLPSSYGQPNYNPYSQSQDFSSQPSMPFGSSPQFQQTRYSAQEEITSKNIEVISSKLDAIRASLDSINQRLENLEAIARGEGESSRRRRYY